MIKTFTLSATILMLTSLAANSNPEVDTADGSTSIGIHSHYGFIYAHTSSLDPIRHLNPRGLSIDLVKHFKTEEAWSYLGTFPNIGLSVSYWDFGDTDLMGRSLTLVGFLEPVLFSTRKISLSLRAGVGPSYQTRPYDPQTNPDNLSYSTKIAIASSINAGVNYRLSDHWSLKLAGHLNHISNGGSRKPNKGVNYPTMSVGLDYTVDPTPFPNHKDFQRKIPESKDRIEGGLFVSNKNSAFNDLSRFMVYGVYGKYSRYLAGISAISTGGELAVDMSIKSQIEDLSPELDHKRASLLIGHEFWIGKLIFSQQAGIYIYDKVKQDTWWYHRWGLTYNFTRNVFVGISFKAHLADADFIDFRVGLSL